MGVPKKKAGGKKKPARAPQQLTAEEYFENAEMAFAMENYDQSRNNFKRALDMEPENTEYLEGYGSFLAEVGPHTEALAVLQKAAQLQPDEGFEKFMYLGQLLEGQQAEQAVRKGITILKRYVQEQAAEPAAAAAGSAEDQEDDAQQAASLKDHLNSLLASALCALAELLMNQAQEAGEGKLEGVQAECEALLGEARAMSPTSPEPLQALASFRQHQGRDDEALTLLRESLALWFKPSPVSDSEGEEEEDEEAAAAAAAADAAEAGPAAAGGGAAAGKASGGGEDAGDSSGSEEEDMDVSDSDDESDEGDLMPSYEFRFETAKLLLELDDTVEVACQVLEQLLDENDSDPNVWLLLAMCCQGGGDLEAALSAVEEGIVLCKKLRLPSDHEIICSFESMQTELTSMLDAAAKEKEEAKAAE
ncbi:hypothetical protein D9Q98_009784 [Chlorella vulgaris]|uniref:Uncharacterized protein n=1 Tax=Chlorella vulgaris TaxID=3077 RepID=A0A9D4YSG2_CHLVU|nr:hypothetical protein D9Q98_009784 [Chlorella vulgaris]